MLTLASLSERSGNAVVLKNITIKRRVGFGSADTCSEQTTQSSKTKFSPLLGRDNLDETSLSTIADDRFTERRKVLELFHGRTKDRDATRDIVVVVVWFDIDERGHGVRFFVCSLSGLEEREQMRPTTGCLFL